jgi:hexosaminidase
MKNYLNPKTDMKMMTSESNASRFHLKYYLLSVSILAVLFSMTSIKTLYASDLSSIGLHVIPYPQQVKLIGNDFIFSNEINIVLDNDHSATDQFTADELIRDLKNEWNIDAAITNKKGARSIILTHHKVQELVGNQSYQILVNEKEIIITAKGEEGLFYGTQTLLQIIQKQTEGYKVTGLQIKDWPDILKRAVHYDTKHHQDKMTYVKSFIKDLARYKINMLVWEWEDKFAYPSHPEIGAPGAFTLEEMQNLTRYAHSYHIQIVPLVQGLGHVSFILKWPQYKDLREIEASNWEFCPLKEGSYKLLFDLWDDAIKATPGSEYIHIGSDETYELGSCDNCRAKAEEMGKNGLYHIFVSRAAQYLQAKGKKVMVWERPMGWERNNKAENKVTPAKNLVLTESYEYETPDFKYVTEAKKQGFEVFAYDPNPGIEPLFLPYKFRKRDGKTISGCLEDSYNFLKSGSNSGLFDGMIRTSWDDSGLHNQMWMLSFITSAEYSWNGKNPSLTEFEDSFYKNYYGDSVSDMSELYNLLNEGAYFFYESFERQVWHYGEIGKTHLPDLPRNDNLEYNPFWNTQYKEKVELSKNEEIKMNRALQIIKNNNKPGTKHSYDFELYRTIAELIQHTSQTYLDLSNLERAISGAHRFTFSNKTEAYNYLVKAQNIVENSLKRRTDVFNDIVITWEKTRLVRGMSTENKKYFFQQDRARHFGNRQPDMSYLIYDEQKLDMEGYLQKLKEYIGYYKSTW